jgi:RNA polymerase sigma factor (TIGR02999 family)
MPTLSTHDITRLLRDWHGGDQAALDQLMPLVYAELRRLAKGYMRRQSPGHTLQTTALINEAYLRMVNLPEIDWQCRAHFYAVAAQAMRYLLIERARARRSAKRGGGAEHVSLDEAAMVSMGRSEELLALDDALNHLATLDPRQSRIVELRYFGGLTVEETAEVLGVSRTVSTDQPAVGRRVGT